jgi:hypothetical protein
VLAVKDGWVAWLQSRLGVLGLPRVRQVFQAEYAQVDQRVNASMLSITNVPHLEQTQRVKQVADGDQIF